MKFIPATTAGKIGVSVTLALILVVALFAGDITGSADGDGMLVRLFIVFLGAIIAIQVVPGMLLFGAIVKALSTLSRKETVKEPEKR